MTAKTPSSASRDVALAVVRDVFGPSQRGAQAAFDYRVRRSDLSPRDRAFAAELTYGAIKMRRALDWYLRPYVGARKQSPPAPILEALRLGIYQMQYMHGVEPHAAVFETVNAALHVGHRGTAGLVNAVLRRFIADAPPPPRIDEFPNEADFLGTLHSVPTWIAAQWLDRLGPRTGAALAGIDAAPQLALCVNLLRASVAEAVAALGDAGAAAEPSPFAHDALIVAQRPDVPIGDDAAGRWAVQGESACIPVDLLDPQPGEIVLDLCSGRGNKAVQLASRMGGSGALTCVELDERKCDELERRLAASGADNAAVVRGDAASAQVEPAAAVLLDAPCSGVGVLGRVPEARWRKSPDDGARLGAAQAALLAAAAERVRPGGRIAYAVCSIDRRECEDVVDAFLAQRRDFERTAPPARYASVTTAAGDVLVAPGIDGRDGFYVALVRRQA